MHHTVPESPQLRCLMPRLGVPHHRRPDLAEVLSLAVHRTKFVAGVMEQPLIGNLSVQNQPISSSTILDMLRRMMLSNNLDGMLFAFLSQIMICTGNAFV